MLFFQVESAFKKATCKSHMQENVFIFWDALLLIFFKILSVLCTGNNFVLYNNIVFHFIIYSKLCFQKNHKIPKDSSKKSGVVRHFMHICSRLSQKML